MFINDKNAVQHEGEKMLEINIYWLTAYALLSMGIVAGLAYSLIISFKDLTGTLKFLLSSAAVINLGIIVHTFAVLEYGSDNALIAGFVAGHLLIMAGFILLIFSGNKILAVSEKIGFGG